VRDIKRVASSIVECTSEALLYEELKGFDHIFAFNVLNDFLKPIAFDGQEKQHIPLKFYPKSTKIFRILMLYLHQYSSRKPEEDLEDVSKRFQSIMYQLELLQHVMNYLLDFQT